MTKHDTIEGLEVGYDIPAAIGMPIDQIQTPCLILDLDALVFGAYIVISIIVLGFYLVQAGHTPMNSSLMSVTWNPAGRCACGMGGTEVTGTSKMAPQVWHRAW